MDMRIRDRFTTLWETCCPGAELPITFELGEAVADAERMPAPGRWRCFVCDLARVRNGRSVVFDRSSLSCSGALYYLGYETERSENFRYFLSCGKPGVVEGERYKKSPEIVDEMDAHHLSLPAGENSYTFKRWDRLCESDDPDVVIFFARPEVLTALFTIANFDRADPNGVICPFGSGCSSIIHYPRLELQSGCPRAVLGMFDPSARPCVPIDVLTIAFSMDRFEAIIADFEESFLITGTWQRQKEKIARSNLLHQK